MFILRMLLHGAAHGHQIGKHISTHDPQFPADAARVALSGTAPPGTKELGSIEMGDGA
jgi:hypothetical protein